MYAIISKDGKGVKYALANLSVFHHKALHGFNGCDQLTLSFDCIDESGKVHRNLTFQLSVDQWDSLDTSVFLARRQQWVNEHIHKHKG